MKLSDVILSGHTNERPVASMDGRLFFDTDIQQLYKDTGSAWILLGGGKGDKGDKGDRGDKGNTGSTGATGQTGSQGIQGVKGDQGDTGLQGIQGTPGAKGDTGDVGPTGQQGLPGAKGDKGDTGDQGLQGVQGVKGDTGLTGAKGDTGAQGIQGIQGIQGNTGNQGIQGVKGDTGSQGIQGIQGVAGVPLPAEVVLSNGTLALALATNIRVKVTPTALGTFTTTVPPTGQICIVKILTSGTSSFTMTFGTGFKSPSTLATGTSSGKYFQVTFISDGTTLYEMCRTAAM